MQEPGAADFSLLGGPLHRLGCRLRLVRGGSTVPLGVAIALLLWTVLVALALLEGAGDEVFSLVAIGAHVRLLLVIPLFFLCESSVDPRMAAFVRTIVQSAVVPQAARPALAAEIARIDRGKASWLAEALCLAAAVLLMLAAPMAQLAGTTMSHEPGRAAEATLLMEYPVAELAERFFTRLSGF